MPSQPASKSCLLYLQNLSQFWAPSRPLPKPHRSSPSSSCAWVIMITSLLVSLLYSLSCDLSLATRVMLWKYIWSCDALLKPLKSIPSLSEERLKSWWWPAGLHTICSLTWYPFCLVLVPLLDALAAILLLDRVEHVPVSKHLYLIFPLPETLFPQVICKAPFRMCPLKSRLIRRAF